MSEATLMSPGSFYLIKTVTMSEEPLPVLEISIDEFSGYSKEAFAEFLLLEEVDQVRLSIPKRSVLYESPNLYIVAEYARMALLGGKLADLGPGFSYTVPRVEKQGAFVFRVTAKDPAALADLLVMALALWEGDWVQLMPYDLEAVELLNSYEGSDHGCYSLCVVAFQFMVMGSGKGDS